MAFVAAAGAVSAMAAGPAAAPPPATAPVDMSASDVGAPLTRLLLEKPTVPITLPKDETPPPYRGDVPVEGSMVVDRLCKLTRDAKAGWWVLSFQDEPTRRPEPPRRALPSRLLEEMEAQAAASPRAMFRVSGETTICNYQGYLLLSKVLVLAQPASAPASQPGVIAPNRPMPLESSLGRPLPRPVTATAPASRPGVAATTPEPSSSDILKGLLSENPGKPVLLTAAPPPPAPVASVAPGAEKPLAAGRESMIIDRVVRIMPDDVGHWWAAHFEADNTLEEPPMKLLPCGILDKAQNDDARKRPGAVLIYRVSGIVTLYRGEQYLLPRKLIIERNMGRF